MKRPSFGLVPILATGAVLFASVVQAEDAWEASLGELGRSSTRFGLHISAGYSAVSGNEVEQVESAVGYEAGLSVRVLGNLSIFGSYAVATGDLEGQLVQILDQKIRSDGRSGNASGDLELSRWRVGVRVDALREKNWPWQPYFLGAVVFSSSEVTLDSVDQSSPPLPVSAGIGQPLIDIRTIKDSQTGALARLGLEYLLTPTIGVDLNFTYEVIELPPGTNANSSINAGLTFRI